MCNWFVSEPTYAHGPDFGTEPNLAKGFDWGNLGCVVESFTPTRHIVSIRIRSCGLDGAANLHGPGRTSDEQQRCNSCPHDMCARVCAESNVVVARHAAGYLARNLNG